MTEHYQTEARIDQIRMMLQDGVSREQIMKSIPDLTDRQLREYTKKIHEQDKELWKDQANESLENRALLIKQKYQKLAKECDEILEDKTKSPRDRMEAGKLSIACENNIYNMLEKGPLRFNKVIPAKELPGTGGDLDGKDE